LWIQASAQATQQTRAPAKPSLKKRVLSGLPARKAPTKSKATTTPTRPTSALKSRAAASLTPRPKQRQAVEKIVAAVQITDESSSVESVDEFSSMPPTQATKPQSRLSRLWSKVVTASKKVITSPSRWFKRK